MNAKAVVLFLFSLLNLHRIVNPSFVCFLHSTLTFGWVPSHSPFMYLLDDKSLMLKKEYKDSLDISVCVFLFYRMLETNL